MKKSILSPLWIRLYGLKIRRLQKIIIDWAYKAEGRQFYSYSLREIYRRYHNVEIGEYTQWNCFEPLMIDRNTQIGRYCSLSSGVRILNHNHPLHFRSTHAFFFNPRLGITKSWEIEYSSLKIGHDVWIGHNAVILPNVTEIGTGAVISAGAVINKNIPPYAVLVGNPSRIVKYRFPVETIQSLLDSQWWEKSIEEIQSNGLEEFRKPMEEFDSLSS